MIRDERQMILTALQNCSIAFSVAGLRAFTVVLALLGQWHRTLYPLLLRGNKAALLQLQGQQRRRSKGEQITAPYTCCGHVLKHLQWGRYLDFSNLKPFLQKYGILLMIFKSFDAGKRRFWTSFFPVDLKNDTCSLSFHFLKTKYLEKFGFHFSTSSTRPTNLKNTRGFSPLVSPSLLPPKPSAAPWVPPAFPACLAKW